MHEEEAPKDVATELAGTIRYVLVEHVRPAIEYLAEASRITDEDLRRQFRRQLAKYEAWEKARRHERPEADPSGDRPPGPEEASLLFSALDAKNTACTPFSGISLEREQA